MSELSPCHNFIMKKCDKITRIVVLEWLLLYNDSSISLYIPNGIVWPYTIFIVLQIGK